MGKTQTYVEFVSNAKKLVKDIGGVDKMMGKLGATVEKHSRTFRNMGLGIAAGLGVATKVAGDFDQSLANMNSVAQASQDELAKIRTLALKLGGATIHGPRKLAEATYWLASAGQKAADMMKTLPGLARLATATQHDLGETTTIVVGALNAFNYAADETDRIAHALAATIGGSQANMDKLGTSLASVGPVAGQFGRDIEEVLAPLARLYDANIEASIAGSGLKNMYLALLAPNAQLIAFTDRTGIALSELDPRARSMTDILETLKDKGFDAADAVEAFGRESATTAAVLMGAGSKALREFQTQITGTDRATQMAEDQQKGFNNQMKLFRSSLEELGIELGTNLLPALTDVAGVLREMVSATSDWSPEAKKAAVNTGVWGAAGLLLLSVYEKLKPKIITVGKGVKWANAMFLLHWQTILKNVAQGGAYIAIADEMGRAGSKAALDQAQALIEQGAAFDEIIMSMRIARDLGADIEQLEWPQPPADWGMEFGVPSSPLPPGYWDDLVPPPDAVTGVETVAAAIDMVADSVVRVSGAMKEWETTFQAVDFAPITNGVEAFLALTFHAHDLGAAIKALGADFGQFLLNEAPAAANSFMATSDRLFTKMAASNGKFFKTLKQASALFLRDTLKAYVQAALGELLIARIVEVGKALIKGTLDWTALAQIPLIMAAHGAASAALSGIKSFAQGGMVQRSGEFTGNFDVGDAIVGPDAVRAMLSGKGGGAKIEAHIHVHGDLAMSKGELDDTLTALADRLALEGGW